VTSTETVPPKVAGLAAERGLGQLGGMPGGESVTADTVAGFEVRPTGGGKLTIRVGGVSNPGYARFCDYLEQSAARAGARLTG
jgi:hypothetical protein